MPCLTPPLLTQRPKVRGSTLVGVLPSLAGDDEKGEVARFAQPERPGRHDFYMESRTLTSLRNFGDVVA